MEINKKDLFTIIDTLKKEIDSNFDEVIKIDSQDLYWEISLENLFDVTKNPEKLTIGQVTDDWLELIRLKEEDEIPISYDLVRLSTVLKLLKINSLGKW